MACYLFFKCTAVYNFWYCTFLCSTLIKSEIDNLLPIIANLELVLCCVTAFTTPLTQLTYSMYLLILQQVRKKKERVQT